MTDAFATVIRFVTVGAGKRRTEGPNSVEKMAGKQFKKAS